MKRLGHIDLTVAQTRSGRVKRAVKQGLETDDDLANHTWEFLKQTLDNIPVSTVLVKFPQTMASRSLLPSEPEGKLGQRIGVDQGENANPSHLSSSSCRRHQLSVSTSSWSWSSSSFDFATPLGSISLLYPLPRSGEPSSSSESPRGDGGRGDGW
jgi:hypothetical protein